MHKKLFIPGPVEVDQDVLDQMARPLIGHRTKEASELQRSISDKLKKLFYTNNEILLSTSSGTGLMEGAVRSCTRKRAAVFSTGAFGNKWYEIAIANGIEADLYQSEPGKPITADIVEKALATGKYDLITLTHNETSTGVMNPVSEISKVIEKYEDIVYCLDTVSSAGGVKIPVDEWGVDICIASTQKALGVPPGMSICTISKKALEVAKTVKNRGFYFDLLKLHEAIIKKDYQYPSTPSISHMYALDYQLDKIFEEGLENRYARHEEMANYVRTWAKKHFELFADENYASITLTNVKNSSNIDVSSLVSQLDDRGYLISNGYGILKNKAFRIGHMAETRLDDIKELLGVIEDILKL
ncbi:pyridoxal-phosphate-dependent aminotransferase family protein [Abyssisolibacter fermentans]|uniref:pyridoxal-phosphate-dependent aminotransferase family protein n=1 Tax=Abyssisolibacter fermentans TaxID=1766203 RepID=UPI00082F785D|nr:alanine--glyoxylate aminotransferase family protein [Abyssisolibacter fermentans]